MVRIKGPEGQTNTLSAGEERIVPLEPGDFVEVIHPPIRGLAQVRIITATEPHVASFTGGGDATAYVDISARLDITVAKESFNLDRGDSATVMQHNPPRRTDVFIE